MNIARWLIWAILLAGLTWTCLYVIRFYNPKVFVPVRGEFIRIGGQQLYMLQKGGGHTILLLSGVPGHMDAYQSWFADNWPGYRLLAVDFPGSGLSDKNIPNPTTPEDLALSLKLLLDKLEIKQADIIGQDLGGGVAIIMAANYPNLVRRLVLIAPDSSAGQAASRIGWWWRHPLLAPALGVIRLDRAYIRDLLTQGWSAKQEGWINFVETYYRPLETAGGREGYLALQTGRFSFDYRAFEERIQAPALILWGKEDRVVAPDSGSELAKRLAGASCRQLAGIGHFVLEEAGVSAAKIVKEFLGTAPATAAP